MSLCGIDLSIQRERRVTVKQQTDGSFADMVGAAAETCGTAEPG
jgi:hypothetical protein